MNHHSKARVYIFHFAPRAPTKILVIGWLGTQYDDNKKKRIYKGEKRKFSLYLGEKYHLRKKEGGQKHQLFG